MSTKRTRAVIGLLLLGGLAAGAALVAGASRDDAAARVKPGRQAEAPGLRLRKPHLHVSRSHFPSI